MPKRWSAIFSVFAAVWILFVITFNLEIIVTSNELGDFGSFVAAGIKFNEGANPYDSDSPYIFEVDFPLVGAGGKMPNLNPPVSLLFFAPLANADPMSALNAWRVVSFGLFLASFLLLAREYKPRPLRLLWGFALAGLWHTLGLGQIYAPLLLLVTLAWLSYRTDKSIAAGIFIGLLVSIKPNFVLWLFLLAMRREWKITISAAVVILACAALPLTQMQPEVYVQWLEASRVDGRVLSMPGNGSLIGLTSRMNLPALGIVLGLALTAITALAVVRAREGRPAPDGVSAAGIFLSLLVSPITWTGYTILALPYFLSQKRWDAATLIAAFILTVPFNFTMYFYYYFGKFNFIFWGWWYGIALTLCAGVTIAALWQRVRMAAAGDAGR